MRDRRRGEEEQQDAAGGHDADRQREDGLREPWRGVRVAARASVVNTGTNGAVSPLATRTSSSELRQDEGRVVGVELGAGAVGAREHPVAHEAGEVAREGQDREQDRALRTGIARAGPDPG